jgi:hypothetical protein
VSGGWVVVAGEVLAVPVPTLLNHEIVPRCPGCGRGVHPRNSSSLNMSPSTRSSFAGVVDVEKGVSEC